MPKVSDDYKEARREQILAAARRCFIRKGFHETSMQDLFAEAGLSSGAVYRYFPSKTDVIAAIAEANMDEVLSLVHSLAGEREHGLGSALGTLMTVVQDKVTHDGLGPMAVLVWSEALRDPALAARVRHFLGQMHAELTVVIRADQQAGRVPEGVDADAFGRLLTALVPGSIVQGAILGTDATEDVPGALRSLWP